MDQSNFLDTKSLPSFYSDVSQLLLERLCNACLSVHKDRLVGVLFHDSSPVMEGAAYSLSEAREKRCHYKRPHTVAFKMTSRSGIYIDL